MSAVTLGLANETALRGEVDDYNSTLTKAHKKAVKAYDNLMEAIEKACEPISYRVKLKGDPEESGEEAEQDEGAEVVAAPEAEVENEESAEDAEAIKVAMQEAYDKLQEKVDTAAEEYNEALAELKEVVEGWEEAISSSWVITRQVGALEREPELQEATKTELADHLSKLVDEAAKTLVSSITAGK